MLAWDEEGALTGVLSVKGFDLEGMKSRLNPLADMGIPSLRIRCLKHR